MASQSQKSRANTATDETADSLNDLARGEDKKWFLMVDGKIEGPLTQNDAETLSQTHGDCQLWGKGQSEWLSREDWLAHLGEWQNGVSQVRQVEWRFRDGPRESQPMNFEALVENLKLFPSYEGLQVWSEQDPYWQDVYVVKQLAHSLGVSRREHQRVPIKGQFDFEEPVGEPSVRAITISEGGLGISETKGVELGQIIRGTLRSQNISAPIQITAEVVFLGKGTYTGVRFRDLADEAKTIIVEYIKKFSDFQPDPEAD